MKDNIKFGDKLWYAVGSLNSISNGIRVDNSAGNTEHFSVEKHYDATIQQFRSKMIGVADTTKLGW